MGVRRAAIALVGLILALVVAITAVLLTRDGDSGGAGQETDPSPQSPSTAAPGSPTPVATPPATPTPTPSEAESPSATPTPAARSAEDTVSGFVEAWLTTDPDDRETRLRATAVPHLADLLLDTDPESIPDAEPDGAPRETALPSGEAPEHSEDARRYRQDLSDGTAVFVDVVPDPDRGWLAAAITPAE